MSLSRTWAVFAGAAVVVSLAAAALEIADGWETVESVAERLYPIWVVALLLLALATAVAVIANLLWHQRRRPFVYANDHEREHDRKIVREVRRILPRKNVGWLEVEDFSEFWLWSGVEPVSVLTNLDAVEHLPYNPELRYRFANLLFAAKLFMSVYREVAVPMRGEEANFDHAGIDESEVPNLTPQQREAWNARTDDLAAHAKAVGDAYDAFIYAAHQAHVLDLSEPP